MQRFFILLAFSFLCIVSFANESGVSGYRLGAGDLISISVFDETNLSLEVRIGLSGQISYPLLGDVVVSGLTPKLLEQKLTIGLKGPYLVAPSVNVSIIEYRPFYVIGEVKKPGSYPFHPGLTVDKAISISGGFTERASKSSIYVIHEDLQHSGKQWDGLEDALEGEKQDEDKRTEKKQVELYDVIQPGDVITIDQSFF
jgi:protein involved in polysaccharide export with SLBB domain